MIGSTVRNDKNLLNQNNNIFFIALICLMLISCGGGGGGSGGGALVQPPTPTYTQYVDFVNNGGTVPNVQGQIFRSTNYYTEFESFSSITLQYSVPDASGNQSISMTGTVDWDGNPFSGSDTFTGTLDSNDHYDLFLDDHLASVHIVQGDADVYTIGFVDFGGLRTVEQTDYVTQLLQYRAYAPSNPESYNRYDLLAFVMGDQTWASDMPSSGSATYNGFAQMLYSFELSWVEDDYVVDHNTQWYLNGTSTFTVDFATRDFTGQLVFDYLAPAWEAEYGQWIDPIAYDWIFELEGTISGTSFSGSRSGDSSEYWYPGSGEYTTSFTGNFFGPNATELGGTFTYSELAWFDDGEEQKYDGVGTFTACQGC